MSVAASLTGFFIPESGLQFVDPEIRQMIRGKPLVSQNQLTLVEAMASGRPVKIDDLNIPGLNGEPPVRILVFTPTASTLRPYPALLFMHGGGYIHGSASDANQVALCMDWAEQLGCVVVSVDYRLSPAAPFPAARNDNYAALLWLFRSARTLGIDPERIAIGGRSAGGGHAAMLALHARDRAEIPVVLQLLICPQLDDRTGSTRDVPIPEDAMTYKPASNRQGWEALLGQPAGSASVPPGSVPAREADLRGVAPAYITTSTLDLFCAEDIDYAQRLHAARVPVGLAVYRGGFHGFSVFAPEATVSKAHDRGVSEALRIAFGGA